MRLHSIRHASQTRTQRIPSSISTLKQPAMRTRDPSRKRWHMTALEGSHADGMRDQLTAWAQARMKAMSVDVERLDDNPDHTDTRLDPPWRTVLVPKSRIEDLQFLQYPCAASSTMLWGVGAERAVANCNPYDINPGAIDCERSSSRPGKGPFQNVSRGAYGNRNFKYLWALDYRGMHIAREMTPCKLSSRGIITHSILVDRGIVGGEIFFDISERGKVCINFGSARLPLQEIRQAEKTAEFVLALGYDTVVAMIPDRNLRECPYGMADRYGSRVQNIVFRRDE